MASALPWPHVTTHAPEPSTATAAGLDPAQVDGMGDMDVESLRAALHASADLIADYLADVERYAVLPRVAPGELTGRLDGPPPEDPTPMDAILADIERDIVPNVTHWQHPGFYAYFASTASGPGLVGEAIMAGLNANAMLWRTSPVATELEAITVGWLRDGLGLPPSFDGLYADTASISTLSALAAAREAVTGDAAEHGLSGSVALRDTRGLRIYASQEAHSSVDKAAMTLGLGRDGVRKIAVDEDSAMNPGALEAAIAEDRAEGFVPAAVVSTVGTTSSTAIDPVAAVADIAARVGIWHHVDAAYAGPVALIPERRGPFVGWERADSIVLNPHKWLFTPLDCSLLLTRRPETLGAAFSLVPEYLRTTGGAGSGRDYNESSPQLGRRARSIKMWVLLRYFGLEGLRRRIEGHLGLARWLAQAIDTEPDAERLAPTPFATVCFRWRPARFTGREHDPHVAATLDALNERLLARLNETGEVFLSHTRLRGRFTLRVAINNLRTEARHVERAWELVRTLGTELDSGAS
jgi:aromatic-L-amino-acid/L-tryptophan decarboxylase